MPVVLLLRRRWEQYFIACTTTTEATIRESSSPLNSEREILNLLTVNSQIQNAKWLLLQVVAATALEK